MEASRDDFIIAIRSAFLKKGNQQRFSLIALIFFSLTILVLSNFKFSLIDNVRSSIKEVVYRSSFIVSVPEKYLKNSYKKIGSHFSYYQDYLNIQKELKKIKSKKISNDYIVAENKELKKIIDDYIINSEEIIAKVLLDKNSPYLKSIVLNKGSKNNIKLGMAVLEEDYLVGKIIEVNYLTSRALLLSDLNSKIPVVILPENIQSILSGAGKVKGNIQYFKKMSDPKDLSIIYTSGSGGIFKSGIPVGSVEKNEENDEINIQFFSDFSQLKFVRIVSFEKEERLLNEKNKKIKAEEEATIKAEEEATIKAEEEATIKAEEEATIKAEEEATIKAEEEALFKEFSKKYIKKCKKTFFNNLYKVGTPQFKACIMEKGFEAQKKKKN
jgi:rod shape-determining protein MreC